MREIKRKRFIYKRVTFLSDPGGNVTLESLLKKAIAALPKAVDRFEEVEVLVKEKRFVNYSGVHTAPGTGADIFGGEFLVFEPGADQSTIAVDQEAKEISVEAIPAGEDHEFLAGSVYFGIVGNHVVLSQSKSLRSADLEEYLNWLLIRKTKLLGSGFGFRLEDHISKGKREKITGVKGINITAPIGLDQESAGPGRYENQNGETQAISVPGSKYYPFKGPAWEALKGFLGGAFPLPAGINVKDILDSPEIEIGLVMKWKSKPENDDNDFLDQVASNLRNVNDEVDFTISAKSGTISRSEIKIFVDQNVPWTKRGRPELNEIFPKMGVWLAELIRERKVDA